jgi:Zn-dependent M28 family amino/carboxypeptidase
MSTTPAARYMYSKTVSRQIFTIAGWLIQNSSPVHRLVLTNHVRFAFWGAEEAGLHGSTFYARHKKDIAVHPLNFDLIGSPNFVRFVFEGDALGASGPNGSGTVERSCSTTSLPRDSRPSPQPSTDAPTTRRS